MSFHGALSSPGQMVSSFKKKAGEFPRDNNQGWMAVVTKQKNITLVRLLYTREEVPTLRCTRVLIFEYSFKPGKSEGMVRNPVKGVQSGKGRILFVFRFYFPT